MHNQSAVSLVGVSKVFCTGSVRTLALRDVDLTVGTGEFLAVTGPSGCGKSTLLGILGLLDSPSKGRFRLFGEEIGQYPEARLAILRRRNVSFIFQNFNLIEDLSVERNVEVALLYRGLGGRERATRVALALECVNLSHRRKHRPHQLSGGQQQRVAVARALVAAPRLLLADEPTGNLDSANGLVVMEMLKEISGRGTTVIMVTHSALHAGYADRSIAMFDGQIAVTPPLCRTAEKWRASQDVQQRATASNASS